MLRLRGRYTLIVVTHNIAQAKRISDTSVLFWGRDGVGSLIEEGAHLLSAPQTQEARDYLQGKLG